MAELDFKTEKLKLEALAKIDLVKGFDEFSKRFEKMSEAKENFLALYNSGEYYSEIYKVLGKILYSSLWRWATIYAKNNNYEDLIPKYKCTKISEYNTKLTPEMIEQFEKFLFHPNKFKVEKAINLTKFCLERKGITDLPANIAFRRYADKFKVLHYDKRVLYREGEKAFKLWYDSILKLPDYYAGTIASWEMNSNNCDKDKHSTVISNVFANNSNFNLIKIMLSDYSFQSSYVSIKCK